MKAIIGLGANLGECAVSLKEAVLAMGRLPNTYVNKVSSLYATEPVGVSGCQPDYINCVAELETAMPPEILMGALLGVEATAGRVRPKDIEKAPRVLDMDMLMYGEGDRYIKKDESWLTLPHPRMLERAFVLVPLSELYPDKRVMGMDFAEEMEKCKNQRVKKLV